MGHFISKPSGKLEPASPKSSVGHQPTSIQTVDDEISNLSNPLTRPLFPHYRLRRHLPPQRHSSRQELFFDLPQFSLGESEFPSLITNSSILFASDDSPTSTRKRPDDPQLNRLQLEFEKKYNFIDTTSQTVDTNGGTLTVRGCLVKIPEGACDRKVEISITSYYGYGKSTMPAANTGNDYVRRLTPMLKCEPEGFEFKKPIEITLATCYRNVEESPVSVIVRQKVNKEWKVIDQLKMDATANSFTFKTFTFNPVDIVVNDEALFYELEKVKYLKVLLTDRRSTELKAMVTITDNLSSAIKPSSDKVLCENKFLLSRRQNDMILSIKGPNNVTIHPQELFLIDLWGETTFNMKVKGDMTTDHEFQISAKSTLSEEIFLTNFVVPKEILDEVLLQRAGEDIQQDDLCISAKVGEGRATIEVGGCKVIIPQNALLNDVEIEISIDNQEADDVIRLTPLIKCKPHGLTFKKEIKIILPTFYRAENDALQVAVRRAKDEFSGFERIGDDLLHHETQSFEFSTNQFSLFDYILFDASKRMNLLREKLLIFGVSPDPTDSPLQIVSSVVVCHNKESAKKLNNKNKLLETDFLLKYEEKELDLQLTGEHLNDLTAKIIDARCERYEKHFPLKKSNGDGWMSDTIQICLTSTSKETFVETDVVITKDDRAPRLQPDVQTSFSHSSFHNATISASLRHNERDTNSFGSRCTLL